MKVVLLCQDQVSLEDSGNIHEGESILLNVMKYYAQHGHKDFILCLGANGCVIKNYFLNFNHITATDFVLTSGSVINLIGTDIDDWNITFQHSISKTKTSQQVFEVKKHLKNESYFVVNGYNKLPGCSLNEFIDQFVESSKTGTALGNFKQGFQNEIPADSFIFRKNVLEYLKPSDELNMKTFARLLKMISATGPTHFGPR